MSGTFLSLVTGDVSDYKDYKSGLPIYPDAPTEDVMWNPGKLSRPGYEFLGFATYPDADEPLFLIPGDGDSLTLFPVWKPITIPSSSSSVTIVQPVTGSDVVIVEEGGELFSIPIEL